MDQVDLKTLSVRESDQIEWKVNVADTDDVVATISAFANDWSNLGGGYASISLSAARLKEVEGKVMPACRDRVSPSIAPLVQERPGTTPDRRVLVFIMPATRSPHLFRKHQGAGRY